MQKAFKMTIAATAAITIIALCGCGQANLHSDAVSASTRRFLSTTNEIPPETEAYLYTAFSDKTERDKYNIPFTGRMETDLDGDGKADTIELLPGKTGGIRDDETRPYQSITVKINGMAATIEAGEDKTFTAYMENGAARLEGTILDLNEKDGRKEVCVYNSEEEWPESHLIIYDGKTVKTAHYPDSIRANGTGYILTYGESNEIKLAGARGINILRIKKYTGDGGFQDIHAQYYRTVYTMFPPINTEMKGATTQWDQYLAKAPGEQADQLLPSGTETFYGRYDPRGWLEMLSRDGATLGWLDCKKVDWNLYTGGEYLPDFGEWKAAAQNGLNTSLRLTFSRCGVASGYTSLLSRTAPCLKPFWIA